MRNLRPFLLLWVGLVSVHIQGQTCKFARPAAEEAWMKSAPTCKAAYERYNTCMWGSSADAGRSSTVFDRCEPLYIHRLNAAQKRVLQEKLNLCGEQFANAEGTMAISEAASCGVEVVYGFATDLVHASQPLPFASFDCADARSTLEKTVCANPKLGHADLVVSMAYKPFFNAVHNEDRIALVASQRAWLASLPSMCSINAQKPSPGAVSCLLKEYDKRAGILSACSNGPEVDCIARSAGDN